MGFQTLHAGPMQRVINIAPKWILGLARQNTSTDAFSLCYELGLPPIFLEMSSARARLGMKLGAVPMKTWIQLSMDNPATYPMRHLTWVTQTTKWLDQIDRERHKYARLFILMKEHITSRDGALLMTTMRPLLNTLKSKTWKDLPM